MKAVTDPLLLQALEGGVDQPQPQAPAYDWTPVETKYGLPSGILNAMMMQESGGRPDAVSPVGARGLFQIMPNTAQELGVDPMDPNQAADGAARYLKQNLDKFGNIDLALAAYNAGPGNVQKYGGIPPFAETQKYVPGVLNRMAPKTTQAAPIVSNMTMAAQVPVGTPVTDPNLLAQLEAPTPNGTPVNGTPVTDPNLIAQLETPEQPQEMGDFRRGLQAALTRSAPENTAGTMEMLAQESPFGGDWLKAGADKVRSLANKTIAPKFQHFSDIHGIGDAIDFAQEQVGSGLGSMVPNLVGMAIGAGAGALTGPAAPVDIPVGAAAGGFAGSATQNYGELFNSLKEEAAAYNADPKNKKKLTDKKLADIAMKWGTPIAALDAIPMLHGAKTVAKAGGEVAGMDMKELAKYALKKYVQGSVEEGVTEGAQEALKKDATTKATDKPFFTKDTAEEVGMAAVGGALAGGVMHGAPATLQAIKEAISPQKPATEQKPATDGQSKSVPPQEPGQVSKTARQAPAEAGVAPTSPAAQTNTNPNTETTPEVPAVQPPAEAPSSTAEAPATRTLTTPNNSMQIEAKPELVEIGSLRTSDHPEYPATRQPRDRTSKRSEAQIQEIVKTFNPERVMDSPTTDQGAPIIGPEDQNFVESGNGRVMALRKIYENPEAAQRYKDALTKAGYDITGMQNPVLVRRRVTKLDDNGLSKFVEDSNRSAGMAQNETEIAQQDARRFTPDIISLYKGGSLQSEANAEFRNRIMKEVIGSEAEAAGVRDAKGGLSQTGERRIRAAMFAYAYQNPQAVENFFTSAEPDLKSIGDVMQDVAPNYAGVRANMTSRGLDQKYDISKNITDALDIIREARNNNDPISVRLNQSSMFGDAHVDPITERLVRGLYNKDLSRIASKKAIDTFLRGYADKVRNFDPNQGDVFGDNNLPEPAAILDSLLKARDAREEAPTQGTLTGTNAPSTRPKKAASRGSDKSVPLEAIDGTEDTPELDFNTKPEPQPKGSRPYGSKTALDYYFTDRQSIFRSLFRDAGFDPDKIASQPEKQLRIAKAHFEKKYGIKVKIDKNVPAPLAIDQLLDLYRNLQYMSAVLQLPESAMGLTKLVENRVTGEDEPSGIHLVLKKTAPYLGAWSNKLRALIMPARTNSFAHEWGHALDYFVLEKLDPEGSYRGFSSKVKQARGEFKPGTVEEAFMHLVNQMYGDGTLDILKLAKMEQQLAGLRGTLKRGSDPSGAKLTPEQIAKIKAKETAIAAEVAKLKEKYSQYYKNAKDIQASDDYWYRPTEMLARGFEAYVAHKVHMNGGTTEGITMDPEAYTSEISDFNKIYPQAEERIRIFQAYEDLMGMIRAWDILGTGDKDPASLPERDMDMLDPSRITRLMPEQQAQAYTGLANRLRNIASREIKEIGVKKAMADESARQPKDPINAFGKIKRAQKMALSTVAEVFRYYEKIYPQAASQIGGIADLVTDRPGNAKAVGQTFLEQVDMDIARFMNDMSRIFKKFDIMGLSGEQNDMLRDLLLGKEIKNAPQSLVKAAATIRDNIYKELWYYMRKAGMDVGYIENTGYLPRETNTAKIMTDQDGFVEAAKKGYDIVFENEHGAIDNVDMEKFLGTIKTINLRRKAQGQDAPFGKNHDGLNALRKNLREQRRISDAVAKGKMDPDEANAKLAKLAEEVQGILDDGLYDEVKGEYADLRANDWLTRINGEEFYDFDRTSPNADFTKHRSLPPEFDDIMKDYYVTNIRDLTIGYIMKAVQRANYVKRFETGTNINDRLKSLAELGVDQRDIANIKALTQYTVGRSSMGAIAKTAAPIMSKVHTGLTVVMLSRAVWSAFAEPMVSGLQAGSVKTAFKSFTDSVKAFAGTASMQDWADLAEHVGFVSDAMSEQHQANRVGGDFMLTEKDSRVLANFFHYTLIAGITSASKIGVLSSGHSFISKLARDVQTATGKKKEMAIDELARLGVPQHRAEEYAKWLGDVGSRAPTIDDLETGLGQMHKLALQRFMDRSIQPARKDKSPMAAGSPYGRLIFSITRFLYSYWENVTKATVKRGVEINKKYGKGAAAQYALTKVAPSLLALYAAHTMFYALRTFLYNHDRWEEWDKKDELLHKMLLGGASQLGGLGPFDILYNAFSGVRWQRDLTSLLAGAHGGYIFQNIERIYRGMPWMDSDKTNTGEYNAIKGAYNLCVAPVLNYALSAAPLGPVSGFLGGLAMQGISSNTASDTIASALVGEKGTKKNKSEKDNNDKEKKTKDKD